MIGTSKLSRIAFAVWTVLILLFLFVPIALIVVYAFNPSNVQSWPLHGLSTKWFSSTWHNAEMRHAFWLSIRAGLASTAIALLLGSMAAFAVHRFRFFGREAISFLLVLPIALPGIITGMALNSFINFSGIGFSLTTIIVGHATFCIVTVYNNVLARLRRTQSSLVEASMDLGADGWQTFRFVTLPMIATALVAGGLLAFAVVRRDRRDDVHGRRAEHAADLDLRQHPPRPAAAAGQRGRVLRDPRQPDPGGAGAPAGTRHRDAAPGGGRGGCRGLIYFY